jgi:predicted transglutaminase-like cysteine proteinase
VFKLDKLVSILCLTISLSAASSSASGFETAETVNTPAGFISRTVQIERGHLSRTWAAVAERYGQSLQLAKGRCQSGDRAACKFVRWREFLTDLENSSEEYQLLRVNRYINSVRYLSDERNWGQVDYWASPEELFGRGGDCEDYAIAKYFSLRGLGIPAERLRVLVLQKENTAHAILLVSQNDEVLVLDNRYQLAE